MKRLRSLPVPALTIAVCLLTSAAAKADPITFTLSDPFQSIAPGATVTFEATVTNNTHHTIYLNGDNSTLDADLDPSDLSDADYDVDFPLSLAADESVTAPLFTVTIPLGTPFDTYAGSFEITGGRDSSDQFDLGSADFDIEVTGSGTVVPEPSSLVLLTSGIAVLAAGLHRRLIQCPSSVSGR